MAKARWRYADFFGNSSAARSAAALTDASSVDEGQHKGSSGCTFLKSFKDLASRYEVREATHILHPSSLTPSSSELHV
jgi:hypothetical protein